MSKVRISYGDFFCTACGANLEKDADRCPKCGAPYDARFRYGGTSAIGAGGVGWSDRGNDPNFKKISKKNRKGIFVFLLIVCVIIFCVMFFSGDLDFDEEGFKIFGILMIILWSFWFLWGFIQSRTGKDWEGVVTGKDKKIETYTRKDEGTKTQIRYRVFFKTNGGKKKTLTQYDTTAWYDYLNEGDRVRYHGRPLSYYEKYDRSRDDYIPCASCGMKRDAREDYCGKCGAPILKAPVMSRQGVTYQYGVQPRPKNDPAPIQTPKSPVSRSTIVYEDEPATPVKASPSSIPQKPAVKMNFCPQCGAKLEPGAKFCSECGNKL